MIPKLIFSDFDGTLTRGNDMDPIFFDVLSSLSRENIPFVIVTGRSISWGHFFLTHFPTLNYIITEGGGALSFKNKKTNRIEDQFLVSQNEIDSLASFCSLFKEKFPQYSLSADSLGRVTDRAIELDDFASEKELLYVQSFMTQKKISSSTSNVHLNFWSGEISKYKAVAQFLNDFFPNIENKNCLFFGDSLNDETMFENFKYSVGVSNIKSVLDRLKNHPSFILEGEGNEGVLGVNNYLKNLFS